MGTARRKQSRISRQKSNKAILIAPLQTSYDLNFKSQKQQENFS